MPYGNSMAYNQGDGAKRLPFDMAMTTLNKTGSHFMSDIPDTNGS